MAVRLQTHGVTAPAYTHAMPALPLIALALTAQADAAPSDDVPGVFPSVYLIGNSLTNDTVPDRLDGRVEFHIDCGKPLPYIAAHPEQPCRKDSRLWTDALAHDRYDRLSFQSHYGTTLEADASTIAVWMALQPQAEVVIHTGWARHAELAKERSQTDPEKIVRKMMMHSPAWYDALLGELRSRFPDRTITRTRCADALWKIADEIEAGTAPQSLDSIESLYRDAIHMQLGPGRYLMHNLMRIALDQPPATEWPEEIAPDMKAYLDGQIAHWAAAGRP